jgi:hypothetical protein
MQDTRNTHPLSTTCLKCKRVSKCLHVREVALSAFLRLPRIIDAYQIFELTASRCTDFSNKKRRDKSPQLTLDLEF